LNPAAAAGFVEHELRAAEDRNPPLAAADLGVPDLCVRPPWTSVATQSRTPSRAVPRKFVFSSIVVKPVPPGGSDAIDPYPQAVSASATSVPAWR
jgi:hypothetical protein